MIELLSARGRMLSYIAHHPKCSINDICGGLFLTRRSIWGAVGEMRYLLEVTKEGRTHRYTLKSVLLADVLIDLANSIRE